MSFGRPDLEASVHTVRRRAAAQGRRPQHGRRSWAFIELPVDPPVCFLRLDVEHERDLGREEPPRLRSQLSLPRRELQLGALRGQRSLATRTVSDDVGKTDWVAVVQLRERLSLAIPPRLVADGPILPECLLNACEIRLVRKRSEDLVRALQRKVDAQPVCERQHDHLLQLPEDNSALPGGHRPCSVRAVHDDVPDGEPHDARACLARAAPDVHVSANTMTKVPERTPSAPMETAAPNAAVVPTPAATRLAPAAPI